jgi:hypothetical protein
MRTRSSNSSLESLPSELFFAIAEHANFETRLALSTTNSKCRTLLLPTIFRTLKVTSNENEANEVLAFAKKAGANVRGISFYGTAKPNADENVDADKDADADENIGAEEDAGAFQRDQQSKEGRLSHKEQILPLAAAELLSGQHLPNMTTLTINFDFDFDNGNCSGTWDSRDDLCDGTSMYAFTVPETDKNMVDDSEAEFPWRKLMAQTWAAVSQNKYVTELIVKDLIPKAVSPWFSPPWEHFLAQILVADIQIWGGDNGAGWEVGTLDGYMYFVSQMGQYFFQHMKKTKKFRLACYEHGPLGSQWAGLEIDLNTMSLRPDCLPELEQLRLEYVNPEVLTLCLILLTSYPNLADTCLSVQDSWSSLSPRLRLSLSISMSASLLANTLIYGSLGQTSSAASVNQAPSGQVSTSRTMQRLH